MDNTKPGNLHPIRKITLVDIGHRTFITRECGHIKEVGSSFNPEKQIWSICMDCPPLSINWVDFKRGYEWICDCGVGHSDPRLIDNATHGCCSKGCCAHDDAPWRV